LLTGQYPLYDYLRELVSVGVPGTTIMGVPHDGDSLSLEA